MKLSYQKSIITISTVCSESNNCTLHKNVKVRYLHLVHLEIKENKRRYSTELHCVGIHTCSIQPNECNDTVSRMHIHEWYQSIENVEN